MKVVRAAGGLLPRVAFQEHVGGALWVNGCSLMGPCWTLHLRPIVRREMSNRMGLTADGIDDRVLGMLASRLRGPGGLRGVSSQPNMATTHFQTFMDAFAAVELRSRLLADDDVLCPPSEDYGYHCTPRNAVTFSAMGVDGVHTAILKVDGQVRDDSPVVLVSPMDTNDVTVVAESLVSFLAVGCAVSTQTMQAVFDAERSGGRQLVPFLSEHFDWHRLLGEERTRPLKAQYGHLVDRRSGRA